MHSIDTTAHLLLSLTNVTHKQRRRTNGIKLKDDLLAFCLLGITVNYPRLQPARQHRLLHRILT